MLLLLRVCIYMYIYVCMQNHLSFFTCHVTFPRLLLAHAFAYYFTYIYLVPPSHECLWMNCYSICPIANQLNRCATINRFVKASAILKVVSTHPTRSIPAATDHRTAWYVKELCFLFNDDSKCEQFVTALLLSYSTFVSTSIGMPNMRNLNRSATICSIHVVNTISSLESVDVSTVDCLLLYHMIGALLTNRTNPLCGLLLFLSGAWEASTNPVVIPKQLEKLVVEWYHNALCHPGETRTELSISQHFYWKNLRKTVHEICTKCKTCQFLKRNKKQYGKLPPKEAETIPWDTLYVDLVVKYQITSQGGESKFQIMPKSNETKYKMTTYSAKFVSNKQSLWLIRLHAG